MCEQEKETYPEFREQIREIAKTDFVKALAAGTVAENEVEFAAVVQMARELFEVTADELTQEGMLRPKIGIHIKDNTEAAIFLVDLWHGEGPTAGFRLSIKLAPTGYDDNMCHIFRSVETPGRGRQSRYDELKYNKTVLAEGIIQQELLGLLQDIADEISLPQETE